ncbi:MAG: S-adenosylmethionine decarboxylase [Patescibacteria group bacterium]|nr:S-adenosylmethionine decarboxylase [Patescibacteria group bacterium]
MTNQSIPLIKQFVALIKIKPFDSSLEFVEELADIMISDLDLKVVKKMCHIFNLAGITLVYILAQSHLVIHTYPENSVAHSDLVICANHNKKEFEKSLRHALYERGVYSIEVKTVKF